MLFGGSKRVWSMVWDCVPFYLELPVKVISVIKPCFIHISIVFEQALFCLDITFTHFVRSKQDRVLLGRYTAFWWMHFWSIAFMIRVKSWLSGIMNPSRCALGLKMFLTKGALSCWIWIHIFYFKWFSGYYSNFS